ncbi:hypothetical protein JCM10908_007102 [Rhodotorula pacifica]|uniref:uncharacterized protein n=1 Tax=Rhodotorula pacifica TaxID=1495444 RepID=UPI00316F38FF
MAAAGLMPLLAQRLVQQSHSPPQSQPIPSPSQGRSPRDALTTPTRSTRRKTSPIATTQSPGTQQQKKDGVFSWADEMLADRYRFIEEVGFGNWGSVWKVSPRDQPNAVLSVKLVHRSKNPASTARLRALWTEFKCVRVLEDDPHPNLIDFYSFIISPSYALCVMPFYARLMPVSLSELHAKPYFLQLLSAVAHLHKHGITHSDIKPSNILLSDDDKEGEGRPILIDFGFAQHYEVGHPEAFLSTLSWGTPEYLSPERAKGALHDERLSDVFALGVTMYEIVVGRTPFEETEDETFLNREALEVYYTRTLSGKFWGQHSLSVSFADLIGSMIHPDPRQRTPSCAAASQHLFFTIPAPAHASAPNVASPAPSTPRRQNRAVPTPVEAVLTPRRLQTPRKTPKSEGRNKAFVVYEDAKDPVATSTPSSSPFAPKPLTLVERTNQTPKSEARPATVKPVPLAKIPKSPPPSRIPIRKPEVSFPTVKSTVDPSAIVPKGVSGHHRIASMPLTSMNLGATRPRVTSQPLLNQARPLPTNSGGKLPSAAEGGPRRVFSSKRKPSPSLADAEVPIKSARGDVALITDSMVAIKARDAVGGGESQSCRQQTPFPTNVRTSAEETAEQDTTELLVGTGSPTFVARTRTYTVTHKSKHSRSECTIGILGYSIASVFLSDLPKLSKNSSRALSNSLKKLSTKHGRRAPSILSIGSSFSGSRRRVSLSDTTFEIIEAERLADRNAHTLPLSLDSPAPKQAEVARARLVSLTRRSKDITPPRPIDPFLIRPSIAVHTTAPVMTLPSEASASLALSSSASPNAFHFNSTEKLQLASSPAASPASDHTTAVLEQSLSSSFRTGAPGSTPALFRPGHRRIPTAIRNTPSVVVHESADDGDCSESDYSRADTPAFDAQLASPPPPPRVVAEARQLPTWVPNEDSDDTDREADVDEPTLKLGSPPPRLRKTPSSTSSRFAEMIQPTARAQRAGQPAQTDAQEGSPRPPSTCSTLPFTNLHHRTDSASTLETLASSDAPSGCSAQDRNPGLHKRSRSVMSFFSLFSPNPSVSTPTSHMSSTLSLARGSRVGEEEGDRTITVGGAQGRPPMKEKKAKKGGRVRKALGRLFR